MQDLQNIPPPDTDTTNRSEDFGSHSEVDQNLDNEPDDNLPLPPDVEDRAPVEEPPDAGGKAPVDENPDERKRIF